jgi:small-conductance mechanosensitive channel/CRP-like cAMP-binding protein
MKDDLLRALGVFAAVVITAALVNRFNPAHRPRNRRLVILFVVYLITLGAHVALLAVGEDAWAARLLVASQLLLSFTLVNVGATLAFSVILPVTGFVMPMIASDLLVGLGYIVATFGVLSGHGLKPTEALATGAVVSAVLAISLQSTLGSILGGVALQLDGSIQEGDWIKLADGNVGRVRTIRWRHTVLETRDWATIIVPNATLLTNNIIILGKRGGKDVPYRMWIGFNVDFRHAPTKVIKVVSEAVVGVAIPGVATDPAPDCLCMDFTKENRESFATYAVRYWLPDLARDDPTNSLVRARIFTALRRAGIPFGIPTAHARIKIDDDTRAQAKAARHAAARISALRAIALFRTLTEVELQTLAGGLSQAIYTAGETITKQGAVAHWLYVLTSGTAEVRMTFDPDDEGPLPATTRTVSRLEAPDVFGEMGLMTGEPRLADVVAISDVECFRLDKATFETVLLARPEIAQELSSKLAHRRVELIAAREGLDEPAKKAREARERDRILGAIKSFFSL